MRVRQPVQIGQMELPQTTDRPQNAVTVARRYLRRERVVSSLVAVGVAAAFLGTFLVSSLPMAVGVGAAIVVLLRVPVVSSNGNARLTTTADPETVLVSFTGPTPPVLVFQWGIAETVSIEDGAAMYHIPYLFGLRSVTVGVESERVSSDDDAQVVELRVTANQQPWSTYTVRVSRRNGRTVVAYDYAAGRRFGLRRIPQRVVAARFRDAALEAQGYTVANRTEEINLRS